RVADVVAVPVGAKHDVDLVKLLVVVRTHGIIHDPRIDKDGLSAGRLDVKRRVTEPRDLNAIEHQLHASSCRTKHSTKKRFSLAATIASFLMQQKTMARRGMQVIQ